jgi:hypothetical protein
MGGRKVSKADLIELARVLGDDQAEALHDESMVCIFERCLARARDVMGPGTRLPPLALVEDRTVEQLRADGDLEPCDHAGAELAIDRATGEETCCDCGGEPPEFFVIGSGKPLPGAREAMAELERDRRDNAELWAKTQGAKGATRSG